MITIALSNQKGGVGKTTSAVTFAAGFARLGMRTLLVDLDSQGNVADCLGMPPGRELARLLNPMAPEELARCVVPSGRKNLDVIRSDKTTAALKTALAGMDFREFALAKALDLDLTPELSTTHPSPGRGGEYDVCILDCAPSVDVLHTASLVAADWLVIPTRLDQLAVKGVRDLLVSMSEVHRLRRSVCQCAGILPTFYDRVTWESQQQLEHLVEQFKKFVLMPIPLDTVCREASRAGKTLYEYAPECRAMRGAKVGAKMAGGYMAALERLLEVVG